MKKSLIFALTLSSVAFLFCFLVGILDFTQDKAGYGIGMMVCAAVNAFCVVMNARNLKKELKPKS